MGRATLLKTNQVSEVNVPAGDCRFSSEGACRLTAYGLGSDVVITAHAPGAGLSALLRFVYPDSRVDPGKAKDNPWLFADTGVSLLLSTLRKCGASNGDIQIQAIGGANVAGQESSEMNGRSNSLAARKALWAEGVLLRSDDLGGDAMRVVWFDPASDRLMVRSDTRSSRVVAETAEEPMLRHLAS